MVRKHFMNGLLALVAVGAVLTGYNAFVADNEDGHTATNHIAEYLALDVDQQSTPSDETTVATDDTAEQPAASQPAEATPESTVATPTETTQPAPSTEPTPVGSAKAETVYTVVEGDTYGCIAEKYYGSFEHWPDIMAANPVSEGFAEYELHVGAKLVLPAVSADALKPASSLCS